MADTFPDATPPTVSQHNSSQHMLDGGFVFSAAREFVCVCVCVCVCAREPVRLRDTDRTAKRGRNRVILLHNAAGGRDAGRERQESGRERKETRCGEPTLLGRVAH